MINLIAMGVMFSALGASMLLSPEPLLVRRGPLEATQESLDYGAEAARRAAESIARTLAASSHIPIQHKAEQAAEFLKDGSQAGLEKLGLAKPPSHLEQWESGLQAAREKAAAPAATTEEPVLGVVPSPSEVLKENAADAHDVTNETADVAKEQAGQPAEAVKDGFLGMEERMRHCLGATHEGEEPPDAQDRSSDSAELVGQLAPAIAQSVGDNIRAAGAKASETAGSSAYESAAEILRDIAKRTQQLVINEEESPVSYQEKIQQAADEATETLNSRGAEAASRLPHVEQLEEEEVDRGFPSKAREGVESLKPTVGDYYDIAKEESAGPPAESINWREEFLNRVGIRSEEDLSRKDVFIGKFRKYYYSEGVFHSAGETLITAATSTENTSKVVRGKALKIKDSAMDRMKHVAGRIYDTVHHKREVGSADSLSGHLDVLKRGTANFWQRMKWITEASLLSSVRAAHLFCFSLVYGSAVWVTFVSGYLLSRAIPRQQFGFVQSQIFPTYLKVIAGGQAVCLILYMLLHAWVKAEAAEKLQYLNLWGMVLCTLANAFFFEPRATKVMFEKLKLEKEEGRGEDNISEGEAINALDDETKVCLLNVDRKFRLLHGCTSMVNLVSLFGMTWHLWHLSRRLVV